MRIYVKNIPAKFIAIRLQATDPKASSTLATIIVAVPGEKKRRQTAIIVAQNSEYSRQCGRGFRLF